MLLPKDPRFNTSRYIDAHNHIIEARMKRTGQNRRRAIFTLAHQYLLGGILLAIAIPWIVPDHWDGTFRSVTVRLDTFMRVLGGSTILVALYFYNCARRLPGEPADGMLDTTNTSQAGSKQDG